MSDENYIEIKLTKNKIAFVDKEDYDNLPELKEKWHVGIKFHTIYAVRNKIFLHDYIMRPPKGLVVDHINHNGLHCYRSNMRNVTQQQNMWNRRTQKEKSYTKYKGIFWRKNKNHWQVTINFEGEKSIHGGCFKDEIEAAKAYDFLATKHYGEFACLNFPGEPLRCDLEYFPKTFTSEYPGVSWINSRNKWLAQVWVKGKNINIGRFDNELDAAKAYQDFVNKLIK